MGFFKRLWSRWRKQEPEWEKETENETQPLRRDSLNLSEAEQREKYVNSCLMQMKDAEESMERLNQEYNVVTSYLTDMEEIEALPPEEKSQVDEAADKITVYEQEKRVYHDKENRMPEEQYRRMGRMAEDAEEGIAKISECEDYQRKIKQDLSRLSGERHAYRYRRQELKSLLMNLRGMVIIISFAFVACTAMLLILQFALRMDTQIGYMLTVTVTALAVVFLYMKYAEAAKELKRVEKSINRIILLQNRVKIRYVNNTNLLEYLCVKYGVQSGKELRELWQRYVEEKEERARYQQMHEELVFYQKELLHLLRQFRILYPEVWLSQTEAITNHKEMVEIRHGLILRRQKLRAQMEYNQKLAMEASGEIRALAEEFPAYTPEIQRLVEDFEKIS